MGFIPLNDFVAGFCAGTSQLIVGQPLDYIKIKMQTSETPKSPLQAAKQIVSEHGLKGFYRGSSSMFMGIGAAIALEFSIFEQGKRFLRKSIGINPDDQLPVHYVGLAGMGVGLVTSTLYCPIQYAKILLQTQKNSQYRGSLHALWSIVLQKGIRQVYRGYLATLLRDSVGCYVYYAAYEGVLLKSSSGRQKAKPQDYLMAGSAAGISYWTYACPFDVIKTKLQSGQPFNQVMKHLSLKTLYRGYSVVLLRSIPVNAVSFMIYQTVQKLLKKHEYLQ